MKLRIFYDKTSYRYSGWKKMQELLEEVIRKEQRVPGEINFIVSRDDDIRSINVEFLEHDYNTDVITFNYNSDNVVNGEVYISLDTVKANARNYKVSLRNELTRVIIHGILHLTGYNDKSEEEKRAMRALEDHWLKVAGED